MRHARPTSIIGLLWHLVRLRRVTWLAIAVLVLGVLFAGLSGTGSPGESRAGGPARFASFNIEFFPKDQRQIEEAFRLMGELGAPAIGLQEITDPKRFGREAKSRLGESWDFAYQAPAMASAKRKLHLGVLYNTAVFQLERMGLRNETRIDGRTRAALQVRLRERSSGKTVTVVVIHFQALPSGRDHRIQQFAGLLRIVRELHTSDRSLVVMGDFNATEEGDRTDLRALAASTGMVWATEGLPCSAFWEREEDCPTSRLDHVLTWKAPSQVVARGGCEQGCELRNSCPLYHRVVSDHCPVVVDLSNLSE